MPDLHGLEEKEAQDRLKKAGLKAQKVDKCNGADQGDPNTKKRRVQCQNPAANSTVPPGSTVEFVVTR